MPPREKPVIFSVLGVLSRMGVLRMLGGDPANAPDLPCLPGLVKRLPREAQAAYVAVEGQPRCFATLVDEEAATEQREATLRHLGSLGDLPLNRHHAPAGDGWDSGGHAGGAGLAGVTAGAGQPVHPRDTGSRDQERAQYRQRPAGGGDRSHCAHGYILLVIAAATGYVSPFCKLESDERRPSVQLASALAEHLGVPEDERPAFVQVARGLSAGLRPAAPARRTEPDYLAARSAQVAAPVTVGGATVTLILGGVGVLRLTGPAQQCARRLRHPARSQVGNLAAPQRPKPFTEASVPGGGGSSTGGAAWNV